MRYVDPSGHDAWDFYVGVCYALADNAANIILPAYTMYSFYKGEKLIDYERNSSFYAGRITGGILATVANIVADVCLGDLLDGVFKRLDSGVSFSIINNRNGCAVVVSSQDASCALDAAAATWSYTKNGRRFCKKWKGVVPKWRI